MCRSHVFPDVYPIFLECFFWIYSTMLVESRCRGHLVFHRLQHLFLNFFACFLGQVGRWCWPCALFGLYPLVGANWEIRNRFANLWDDGGWAHLATRAGAVDRMVLYLVSTDDCLHPSGNNMEQLYKCSLEHELIIHLCYKFRMMLSMLCLYHLYIVTTFRESFFARCNAQVFVLIQPF